MSEIRDTISQELKLAMKSKDKVRLGTIRLIKSEIMKKETAKGAEDLDEQGLIQLLQTMKKQRLDSIKFFEEGDRQELADKEKGEIAVIETFLPTQMSDDELKRIVTEIVAELGVTDVKGMGQVMKVARAKIAGQADGKRISSAVKACLG